MATSHFKPLKFIEYPESEMQKRAQDFHTLVQKRRTVRDFSFTPTSQFGIGFLSVFATSNYVTVETYKPSIGSFAEPIKLTLTGPRNYLLSDTGSRNKPGTSVEIILTKSFAKGQMTNLVRNWCKRLEFPIWIDDLDSKTIVEADKAEQFVSEIPDFSEEDAKFLIRTFPLNIKGHEGEIYIFSRITKKGESWVSRPWAGNSYLTQFPHARIPEMPFQYKCLHGIRLERGSPYSSLYDFFTIQVDHRDSTFHPTISRTTRQPFRIISENNIDKDISFRIDEILQEHLASTPFSQKPDGWRYKQTLARKMGTKNFWSTVLESIRLYNEQGNVFHLSLQDTLQIPQLSIIFHTLDDYTKTRFDLSKIPWHQISNPVIIIPDLDVLNEEFRFSLFSNRKPIAFRNLGNSYYVCDWSQNSLEPFWKIRNDHFYILPFLDAHAIGQETHSINQTHDKMILLNEINVLIQWYMAYQKACLNKQFGLNEQHFSMSIEILRDCIKYIFNYLTKLKSHIEGLKQSSILPPELRPPDIEITPEMFTLQGDSENDGE